MPDLTVMISREAENRLNLRVAEYNLANGTTLSLTQWVALHLRELALEPDLLRAAEDIRTQAERDVAAAIVAERERLMGLM
jgi:nucleoid-associated protein YejK